MIEKDAPFFVNGSGAPLSRIQNSPGSLLSKIGAVVGIPDLNPTMLRKAAEQTIQTDSEMRKNSKKLLMHSENVGHAIYHEVPTIRSEWVHRMEQVEAPDGKVESEVDIEMETEMDELEKADAEARVEYAEKFALEDRIQRNMNRRCSTRCKVPSNDRVFLQKLIFKELFGSVYQTFPGVFA